MFLFVALTLAATFTFPGQTITVPDGFEIERIAGPPLVHRPIVGDFDERGRLYVAESAGAIQRADFLAHKRPHWISRLEDSDGDGRFDRKTVFADKMSMPEGTMWHSGALYVATAPEIWKLEDTDDDGVADRRTTWLKGFPLKECGDDVHGPTLGPDGWFYWTKGDLGALKIERNGRVIVDDKATHIFRARPDGSGIEAIVGGGMDNPVDVSHSAEGEAFFTSTFIANPRGGLRDGLLHAVWGSTFGRIQSAMEGLTRTGEVMPTMSHLGVAAPAGLHRYQSAALGSAYTGNLFSAQFNLRRVQRHVLEPLGATFRTRDQDFVVSDNADFHPTDVFEDADGSLIAIDTGGWYQVCCPTSQIAKPQVLGAIYRIRRKGAARVDDPRGAKIWATIGAKIPFGEVPAAKLVALLDDERPYVQRRAIEQLAKGGAAAVTALAEKLRGGPTLGRRNAVWALARIETPQAQAVVRERLGDADASVRQAALHTVSLLRDELAAPRLMKLLTASPHAAREAAAGLGRIRARAAVPALLAAAAHGRDRTLEHALVYALIEIGDAPATRRGLRSASSRTRRAALLALSEMGRGALDPHEVVPLLASKDPILRETASFVAGRHRDWGAAVLAAYRPWLSDRNLSEERREELRQRLVTYAADPAVQATIAEALGAATTPAPMRIVLLRAMAETPLRAAPVSWVAEVGRALAAPEESVVVQAIETARVLWRAGQPSDLVGALVALGRSDRRPPELRLAAIGALPEGHALEEASFRFLVANLAPEHAPLRRAAAAEALGRLGLQEPQLLALADVLVSAGALELPKLLAAYERASSGPVGAKLVATLHQAQSLQSLRALALTRALAKFPAAVKKNGEALLAKIQQDLAEQRSHLAALAAKLRGGDPLRGSTVFNSPKAACSICHRIGWVGDKIGPDLTTIGRIRTPTDLLESIVYPSATFVRGFEPFAVTTNDGSAFAGVLRDETSEGFRLVASATNDKRILRADVREMLPDSVSIMPAGFDQVVTPTELADLVAFLMTLKER